MSDQLRAPWTTQVERIAHDERLRIPPAYRQPCDYCGADLDTRTPGVHEWVAGWVKNRTGGGGHGMSLPQRFGRYAHDGCVRAAVAGRLDQPGLFG